MTADDFGRKVAHLMADAIQSGVRPNEIRDHLVGGAAALTLGMHGAPSPDHINHVVRATVDALNAAAGRKVGQ